MDELNKHFEDLKIPSEDVADIRDYIAKHGDTRKGIEAYIQGQHDDLADAKRQLKERGYDL